MAAGVYPPGVGAQTQPAPPVCALLDPDRAPRVALLEAKLLADPSATWVERSAIAKILKEQTLQAAFGPQGGADRVRLGKLLKADLLVLVRAVKDAKEPALEVVVSDTARGLRLAVRALGITQSAEADVAELAAAVRAGLKKFREDIREVVAVPPFASTNLEFAYEHLQGAYAKLVEQAALTQPGVVVVELAEAEAIAREIKLSDPGATVQRPLPLYLLGEFRHEGRGADLRVALKLRATRGGLEVGKGLAQVVAPLDAPAVLRAWALDRLGAAKAGLDAASDSKKEAKQLAELARNRQRVGDWDDAMALLEASLLLDRAQPELNADAMVMLRYWIEQTLGRERKHPDRLRQAAQLHRRGLEHMETLVASGAKLPRFQGFGTPEQGRVFDSPFPFPRKRDPYASYVPPPDPPDVRAIIEALTQDRRAACARVLPYVVKDGTDREVILLVRISVGEPNSAQRFAEYGRLILQHQDSPAMIAALNQILAPFGAYTPADFDEYRQLLDRLDKHGNAGVREAVGRFRQTLPNSEKMAARLAAEEAERKKQREAAQKNQPPRPPYRANATRAELDLEIDLYLKGGPLRRIPLAAASPDDDWFIDHVKGMVAAGPGIDVFWATARFPHARPGDDPARPKVGGAWIKSGPALLVMKDKGVLKRVFAKPGAPEKVVDACFDGKYVWVVAVAEVLRKPSALFVLDPVTEKTVEVTAADGLPEPPAEFAQDPRRIETLPLRLAPLDPGRVCVTGWFGRAWVGIATFDASTAKPAVKVIHEAREAPRQGEKEPWLNPNLSFVPDYALTVRGKPDAEGAAPARVMIGRGWPTSQVRVSDYLPQMGPHPLLVDPSGSLAVVRKPVPVGGWQVHAYAASAEASHYVASSRGLTVNLFRFEFPGTVRDLGKLAFTRVSTDLPGAVAGDRLVFAPLNFGGKATPQPGGGEGYGSSWWTADLDGKNLRKLADDILHVRAIRRSSHYGLVAWCDLSASVPRLACCEVLAPPLGK
jgi:hypothetical protein